MLITRYTVNGYGIFTQMNGLYKADEEALMDEMDWQEFMHVEYFFDRNLPMPDIERDERKKSRSWFTKKGLDMFRDELESLLYLYKKYIGEPEIHVMEVSDKDVIYADEYQILISA